MNQNKKGEKSYFSQCDGTNKTLNLNNRLRIELL